MLQELPLEIIERIGFSLDQNDIISLMLTNSTFHNLLQPLLYSVINIDATPKFFHDHDTPGLKEFFYQYNVYKLDQYNFVKAVTIRSTFQLKLFFKKVAKYAHHVRKFMCMQLPDIPDLEVVDYLQLVLPMMKQLELFYWDHNYAIPATLLRGNLQLRQVQGYIEGITWLPVLKEGVYTNTEGDVPMNLSTLCLRNADLTNFTYDYSQTKSLTIENCTYKRNYLLCQDFSGLRHLTIDMESDSSIPTLLSRLQLESLEIKSIASTNRLLDLLASEKLYSLQIMPALEVHDMKQLTRFTNLKYLELSILEKDLLELLRFLTTSPPLLLLLQQQQEQQQQQQQQKLEFISFNVLEPSERNNSLIAEEYWQCSRTSINIVDLNRQKYQDFALEYHRKLNDLRWVMFNGNGKKYMFEFDAEKSVIYRDGLESYFSRLVNTLI